MRKVWYSVAMSLDGFIAGPNGEYDWIPNEPGIDWGAFTSRFDTLLMGRVTWEAAAAAGRGSGMPGMRSVLFSRTVSTAPDGIELVREDAAAAVRAMREADGKDIWLFGGGGLFRSLLAADQVDMIEVGLCPTTLGAGIPFLPPGAPLARRLELADTRRHGSGIMLLSYRVLPVAA